MRLVAVDYAQNEGLSNEWRLSGLSLGDVNLVVGKNASGKTWTLNVIKGLASMLAGESKVTFLSGHFKVHFEGDGRTISYELLVTENKVVREHLVGDGEVWIDRGEGGTGQI